MLLVPEDVREITRVLIACSGSKASATALRQFVQLRIWPGAEIELVCLADEMDAARPVLEAAAEYLSAHGIGANLTPMKGNDPGAILARAGEWKADLLVGGAGFQRADHDGSSQAILEALVGQRDLPLFIGR